MSLRSLSTQLAWNLPFLDSMEKIIYALTGKGRPVERSKRSESEELMIWGVF
jgi:hypothetical protein